VLHESYGYSPCYFVTARAGGFGGMLPVMEVSSRWTGRRGVSLPFTDGCDPLSAPGCDARPLVEAAVQHAGERAWRYVEFRGRGEPVRPLPRLERLQAPCDVFPPGGGEGTRGRQGQGFYGEGDHGQDDAADRGFGG